MRPVFRNLAHWIREQRDFPRNLLTRTMAGGARETTCLRYCEGKAEGVTLVRPGVMVSSHMEPDNSNPATFRVDGEWSGEKNDTEVFVQYGLGNQVLIWTLNPFQVYNDIHNPFTADDEIVNLLPFSFTINGSTFTGTLSSLYPPISNHPEGGVVLTRTYATGINLATHVTP